MPPDPRFGAVVRERRERLALSEQELAAASRLSLTTVRRVERGERDPRLTTIVALARGLGTTASVLVDEAFGASAAR